MWHIHHQVRGRAQGARGSRGRGRRGQEDPDHEQTREPAHLSPSWSIGAICAAHARDRAGTGLAQHTGVRPCHTGPDRVTGLLHSTDRNALIRLMTDPPTARLDTGALHSADAPTRRTTCVLAAFRARWRGDAAGRASRLPRTRQSTSPGRRAQQAPPVASRHLAAGLRARSGPAAEASRPRVRRARRDSQLQYPWNEKWAVDGSAQLGFDAPIPPPVGRNRSARPCR